MAAEATVTIPDGYTLHTENTSRILLPSTNEAFLNPIQEFNRDISVACITTWSEDLDKAKESKWQERRSKKLNTAGGSDKKRLKSESAAALEYSPLIDDENDYLENETVPRSTTESNVEDDPRSPEDVVQTSSTAETTQTPMKNEVYSMSPTFNNQSEPLDEAAISTKQSCDIRGALCDWPTLYSLCEGNTPRKVSVF